MNPLVVIQLIDTLLTVTTQLLRLRSDLEIIRIQIAQMVAEGRDPTPEEWQAVGTSIDDRLARLREKVNIQAP